MAGGQCWPSSSLCKEAPWPQHGQGDDAGLRGQSMAALVTLDDDMSQNALVLQVQSA